MAETLVELVARISADATELKKALGDSEKQTETSSKHMSDSIKKIGIAMTAAGAAVIAAMGLMTKSAIDEEINIKRLSITMNNVGVSYDKVKDSLEAVISATQRKTGISDSAQRDILGRLILITQDYDKALGLLPTTLDLAAAGEMDATTAATYLGKAYLDLQAGANEVSVRFGQASIQFKSMEDIQNRVRGSAENLKNPLIGIKNAVSDVSEAIGKNFIPIIKTVTNAIEDIAIKIQDWIRLHPELTKGLTLLTAGVGAVLLVVGSTILILPQIIAGIKSLTIVVGLATAANIAYAASIAGILVGLGMIGYGISYIMAGEEAYNRVKTQGMQLDVQRERYLRGEANNYQELLGRYLPTIEAYIELTKARGADT
ncbi:MAG: hypothetical protein KKD77_20370, partial [Gammaproteobacteria bacterium]|nr:hypothetical protein [Gammaproteobacteria bacterium]